MDWQVGWVGKAVRILDIVSSIPSGGNFIFTDFEPLPHVNFVQNCQKCQICVIEEKLEWQCPLRKKEDFLTF